MSNTLLAESSEVDDASILCWSSSSDVAETAAHLPHKLAEIGRPAVQSSQQLRQLLHCRLAGAHCTSIQHTPAQSAADSNVVTTTDTEALSRRKLQPRTPSAILKAMLPCLLTFVNIIVLHVHTKEELLLGSGLVNLCEDDPQLAPPCSSAVGIKHQAGMPAKHALCNTQRCSH